MLAFGYEECQFLNEAEAAASRALEISDREPWAQHALAHVMMAGGRVPEGSRFLRRAAPAWQNLNSFMYTHNWWHLALFLISLGDEEGVFEIYDRHCWAMDKDYSQDQIGAVSLLARMEMAGMDTDHRWDDLGERLKSRAKDTLQPFVTVQYLYGLARAGLPEADELMQAIEDRARTAPEFERAAWAEVALPCAGGFLALHRHRYEEAAQLLAIAAPRSMEMGGSHAQRDLFAQALLEAHIKAGHLVTAQQLLEARRSWDPDGAVVNRKLAAIYEKLGLIDEAHTARRRRYA
jgi:hypothetical protein